MSPYVRRRYCCQHDRVIARSNGAIVRKIRHFINNILVYPEVVGRKRRGFSVRLVYTIYVLVTVRSIPLLVFTSR